MIEMSGRLWPQTKFEVEHLVEKFGPAHPIIIDNYTDGEYFTVRKIPNQNAYLVWEEGERLPKYYKDTEWKNFIEGWLSKNTDEYGCSPVCMWDPDDTSCYMGFYVGEE